MNVAVLICTYGGDLWNEIAEQYALASVERQTLKPTQIVRRHDPGALLHDVRNAAAKETDAEWLCFLDADDELDPGYLSAMSFAAAHMPDPALLVPAVEHFGPDGEVAEPARILNDGRPLLEINRAVIGTLIPADLFRQVGGFRGWQAYEDWDLILRCCAAGAWLVDVPNAVYRALWRPYSRNRQARSLLQQTYWAIRDEHVRWCETHGVEACAQ